MGARDNQMQSLRGANKALGGAAPLLEVGRPRTHIVGIGCKDVHKPLREHALGPIARAPAKAPKQRTGGDLHPHAARRQRLDDIIFAFDP